ncbi:xanthine dehydrogenase accessory protein XdhC [Actibacterium lipolyticum]|uniref:XdhC and CoxI family protein n=1 Tax=Actibacterium lipolyticum TaxID=1524263 RepID=A0A238JKU3_9RHOB|nr:xanthine dehydrogenase accessory protein XdhC [Actibacterium lipolyticum]SMX31280.1 XdhC and CoxI family protein [Actibacterium lipolyticum]
MSFDRHQLAAAIRTHGPVARVVIAAIDGSTPREVGTAMLVWPDGQSGTIGGGTLEYEAAKGARAQLAIGKTQAMARVPLGPTLGQCCGGAVTLLTEVFDDARLATLPQDVFARPIGAPSDCPISVNRILQGARNAGQPVQAQLLDGWLVEPMEKPASALWVFGAGHVGRALVHTMAPLPDFNISWIDTAENRFPDTIPDNVERIIAQNPAEVARYAPADAHHLILTYSHALDLELCHQLLCHGFASAGLIGSATKWARFRKRLAGLGHTSAQISRIRCPIGQPELGKHPQAIAVGVAAALIMEKSADEAAKGATG